jgi:hypothetical protein
MIKFIEFINEKIFKEEDIEDNQYYSFKVFHIPQNRDMGIVKDTGKKLKAFLNNKSFTIDKIKKTISPSEDKEKYIKGQKAKANFLKAWDGKR